MQKPAGIMILIAAICVAAVPARAAKLEFIPFLAVGAEFNDNIYETVNNKRSEYITHVRPGFTSKYQAPFWNWDMAYNFDYRRYERNSHSEEYTHDAGLKGTVMLVENLLHVDVSDTYRRVSTDITRDATYQNSLFLNQTDQNIAMVSPYLLFRPGQKSTVKTGYRYTDVRYWGEGIEKRGHAAFADFSHELSEKLALTASYVFDAVQTDSTNYDKHDASVGFRYGFAEKSSLFAQVGNTWQSFDTGRNVSYLFWNAGLVHDLGFAVATLNTGVQISEDPLGISTKSTSYSARLDKEFARGKAGIFTSYTEYEDTETVRSTGERVLTFGGLGSYELLQSLVANLGGVCDKYGGQIATEPDYRVTGTAGLTYLFNYDISLALNYSYVTYLGASEGDRQVNRAIVDLKKTF